MRRTQPGRAALARRTGLPGVTLVELIVVISMVAVLMAILLPALRGARGAAIDAKALSNVRQNVQEIYAYAAAHDGKAPRADLTEPYQAIPPRAIFVHPTRPDVSIVTDYFGQGNLWNLVLLLAGHPPSEAWLSPTARLRVGSVEQLRSFFGSWYTMSAAYLAGPEHWRVDSNQDASSWRAVRLDETAFTASKALLFNPILSIDQGSITPRVMSVVGFADGHGEWRRLVDARHPVPLRTTTGAFYTDGIPLFSTRDGVQGRDF